MRIVPATHKILRLAAVIAFLVAKVAACSAGISWAPDSGGDPGVRQLVTEAYELPLLDGAGGVAAADAVAAERARLTAIMRSHGYLDAIVDVFLPQAGQGAASAATLVPRFGSRYRLAALRIEGIPAAFRDRLPLRELFDLGARAIGRPVDDGAIDLLRDTILQRIRDTSFAFAKAASVRRETDLRTHTLSLVLQLDTGTPVVFGTLVVHGLRRLPEETVMEAVDFPAGLDFRTDRLAAIRTALEDSGLFRKAAVSLGSPPGGSKADVHVQVEELPPSWQSLLPVAWPGLLMCGMGLAGLFLRQLAASWPVRAGMLRALDGALAVVIVAALILLFRQLIVLAVVN